MGILYHVIKNPNYRPQQLEPTAARVDSVETKQDQKPKTEGANEYEKSNVEH